MSAIILSIGDELVLGQTIDTNSAWLSQQLAAAGVPVMAHITVADDQSAIEQAIQESIQRCRFLIATGGIGPTADDLTRQALAAVMKQPLVSNDAWLAKLHKFFRRLGREMPGMNAIQAMIPQGADIIWNHHGTAAGIYARLTPDTHVFVMPGVPKEMHNMFRADVLPKIEALSAEHANGGGVILSRTLHTFGQGESAVAQLLGELMVRTRNPSVGTTVSHGIVSVRINARFPSRAEAQQRLEETERLCRQALGDLIYGADDDTLPGVVAHLLAASRKTLTTAESCTGGLVAKYLTDVPGSSAYFKQGWITYSNEAKSSQLGIGAELISEVGAVSETVAVAMAMQAAEIAGSDFGIGVTGIAGPTGGTDDKPVGTVWIAVTDNQQRGQPTKARKFLLPGDREMIRDRSAKMALTMLRYHLLGKPMPF